MCGGSEDEGGKGGGEAGVLMVGDGGGGRAGVGGVGVDRWGCRVGVGVGRWGGQPWDNHHCQEVMYINET